MDLITGAIAVIGTLCVVVPILYRQLQNVEARFNTKLEAAEATCRADLDKERKAREDSDKLLRVLEHDVRQLLVGEVAKNSQALAYFGGKLGDLVEAVDDVREHFGMALRPHDPQHATTVALMALTGAQK